jgi:hypothetical protein
MSRQSRYVITLMLAAAMVLGLGAAATFASEGAFVGKVNSARSANGKASVQVHSDLRDDARAHAKRMAQQGKVSSVPNIGSVISGWKALGEVNGAGPDVDLIFKAFMSSGGTKRTILGGYNYIGVGVATDDNGTMWVSMIFMFKPDDGGDPPPESTTTTTTSTEPPAPSPSTTRAPTTATSTTTTIAAATDSPNEESGKSSPTEAPTPGAQVAVRSAPSTTTAAPTPDATAPPPSTTTTPPASGEDAAAPLAAGPDVGGDNGTSIGGLAVLGLIALAGALFVLFARASGEPRPARTGPVVPTMTTAFDGCGSCGLVFNQQKHSNCPRCGTAT